MQFLFFDLNKTKNGDFTVDASLRPMDGTGINIAAMPWFVQINSLTIKKLKAHVTGNKYNAHSSILFIYDDLKITALKPDDGKLKHRSFLTFVANTFILNKPNAAAKAKEQYVSYTRDVHHSFFRLIWKSILQGIISTAS